MEIEQLLTATRSARKTLDLAADVDLADVRRRLEPEARQLGQGLALERDGREDLIEKLTERKTTIRGH